jgi:hypothetical protein
MQSHTENATFKTHAALHVAQCAARCPIEQIGHVFCCTPKTHVIAADRSLHIQAAHSKRKCNRPLSAGMGDQISGGTLCVVGHVHCMGAVGLVVVTLSLPFFLEVFCFI